MCTKSTFSFYTFILNKIHDNCTIYKTLRKVQKKLAKVSRVERQAYKNYVLVLVLCTFKNIKSIYKYIKSIF